MLPRPLFPILLLVGCTAVSASAQPFQAEAVVVSGQAAPGIGGTYVGFFGGLPEPNASSELFATATLTGASTNNALFRFSGGVGTPLVREGDPAPQGGGAVIGFLMGLALGDDGKVLYVANGFSPPLFAGLLLADDTGSTVVVLDGTAAPGVPGGVLESFGSAARNGLGQVGFEATVRVAGLPVDGIFLADGAALSRLALEGNAVPGAGGATLVNVLQVTDMNDAAEVAFTALLSAPRAGEQGVFVASPSGLRTVALEGDAAPGGGTFTGFEQVPRLNASGRVAFSASVDGDANAGVFVETAGGLAAAARVGDPAPGTATTFEQLLSPDLNDDGDVLFTGHPVDEAGGLFLARSGSPPQAVHLPGDPAPAPLAGSWTSLGGPRWGPNGDFAFWSYLDGGAWGFFLSSPVTPSVPFSPLWSLPLAALLVATGRRRS